MANPDNNNYVIVKKVKYCCNAFRRAVKDEFMAAPNGDLDIEGYRIYTSKGYINVDYCPYCGKRLNNI